MFNVANHNVQNVVGVKGDQTSVTNRPPPRNHQPMRNLNPNLEHQRMPDIGISLSSLSATWPGTCDDTFDTDSQLGPVTSRSVPPVSWVVTGPDMTHVSTPGGSGRSPRSLSLSVSPASPLSSPLSRTQTDLDIGVPDLPDLRPGSGNSAPLPSGMTRAGGNPVVISG